MSYKQPGEWKMFSTISLRKFVRRFMKPKTFSQVYRNKTYLAGAYLVTTLVLFHRLAFRHVKEATKDSDLQRAVDLNIPDAKIVRIREGRIDEVLDYRREDYPELIENRAPYARE